MAISDIDEEKLRHEFADMIAELAEQKYRGQQHEAFVAWYVEAEYGQVDWRFTDDTNDGGIDALITGLREPPGVVVIQSKFSERLGRGTVSGAACRDFADLANVFRRGGDGFNALLQHVRSDFRRDILRTREVLASPDRTWHQSKKAFRFISTLRVPRTTCHGLPPGAVVGWDDIAALYRQYRRAQTPKARDLVLTVDQKLAYREGDRRAFLFNAQVAEFKAYVDEYDVSRLVARNVRYEVGGRIGRRVRETYEKRPGDFWFHHNGLTIICDRYTEEDGRLTLNNPSVVNGAQTLYSLSHSTVKNAPALVTTRLIVRGDSRGPGGLEDDGWLQGVIRGVNTQNRVKASDFWSNNPEQIELQKLFRSVRVFYERKRGEWGEFRNEPRFRGFERVSLPLVGAVLAATSKDDGSGVLRVKRGREKVFDDEAFYLKLFPARTVLSRRFARIYLTVRLYKALRKHGFKDANDLRKRRHLVMNCLWLSNMGVLSAPKILSKLDVELLRQRFDSLDKPASRDIIKQRRTLCNLVDLSWKVFHQFQRVDPDRWTANNFFKSGDGLRALSQQVLPKMKPDFEKLGVWLTER